MLYYEKILLLTKFYGIYCYIIKISLVQTVLWTSIPKYWWKFI